MVIGYRYLFVVPKRDKNGRRIIITRPGKILKYKIRYLPTRILHIFILWEKLELISMVREQK